MPTAKGERFLAGKGGGGDGKMGGVVRKGVKWN